MSNKGSERRRGVSLSLSERVFRTNRTLAVPITSVQETNVTLGLPTTRRIRLHFDDNTVQDNWEPTWIKFDHIDTALEKQIHRSTQPYMTLINDALAEVSRLQKQRAAKNIQPKTEPPKIQTIKQPTPDETHKVAKEIKIVVQSPQQIAQQNEEQRKQQYQQPISYVPCNTHTRQIDEYETVYGRLKNEYEAFVNSMDPAVKQARLDIAKRIITTINTLAGTQKQIDNSYSTLVDIKNLYRSEPTVLVFMTFRVIESALDCCEPGSQMYLNPKSVWAFAHLIRGLLAVYPTCREIYYSMIKRRSLYTIPRLYQSDDEEKLKQLHQYSKQNNNTYFKRQVALVRLHLALMVVTQDMEGLWVWFAGFLNACTKNVFKQPLSGILITALTTSGFKCLEVYKCHFKKVLAYSEDLYKRRIFKVKNCDSAEMYNEQLQEFFKEYRNKGTIPEPEGFTLKQQEEKLHKDI